MFTGKTTMFTLATVYDCLVYGFKKLGKYKVLLNKFLEFCILDLNRHLLLRIMPRETTTSNNEQTWRNEIEQRGLYVG